ncbi:MAG: transcriptional regulator [Planctomycetes bacterium GWF2_42_9]|nr:MAG: transcriptional regulator [Planctomycetes bacterium GWF2_42_9]
MPKTYIDRLIVLARQKGLLRTRDVVKEGIPRQYLKIACKRKMLERRGRGLYSVPGNLMDENISLAEVCKIVPKGVICLLSALSYHNLTTQLPSEVWFAISEKARIPKVETVSIRIFRFSENALNSGVEIKVAHGAEIRVFSAAKTVADCFKYRNKIGLDVAIEALRDCRHKRKCTMDDLWHYAKICRVANVMRPYLEAVV